MSMLDVMEPSKVGANFASKKDVSFTSYVKPHNKTKECDQISIFDATKYFSCLNDNQQQEERAQCTKEHDDVSSIPPRLSSVSSSRETISSYRMRSFNATPTASSEASWNSQAGLLANPPGSNGIRLVKSFSSNSSGSSRGIDKSNVSAKWARISSKWLRRGTKCPCSGKKSVQVEERIDSKTTMPKMVDLRRSTSSNDTSPLYSPRKCSPRSLSINVHSSTLPIVPLDSKNSNVNHRDENPIEKPGYPCNIVNNNGHSNGDIAKDNKGGSATSTNVITAAAATTTVIASETDNVFTFPILETQPVGLKKMFNVIPPSHRNKDDPYRDLLEVLQPRSHPSPKSRRRSYEDENASDGSSDLFEIESFSTTTCPYRDSIDEVIIPSSNFDTTMKRLGLISPSYNNQATNNNNVDQNGDDVGEEYVTLSIGPNDCDGTNEMSINWWSNNNTKGCRNEKMVSVGPSPIKYLGQDGPQDVARHVRGGPQGERTAHVNESGMSKARLVVGRSLSTILSMPFAI